LEVFLAAFVPSVDLAGALEAVAGALPAVEAGLGAIATEDEVRGREEDNGQRRVVSQLMRLGYIRTRHVVHVWATQLC